MTMLDYIMEQPDIFQSIMRQNGNITGDFGTVFCKELPEQIYLIASGTSCNAAKAAAPFMEMVLKRQVSVFAPSQISHVFGKNPLVVFISQGGKSTNMIRAVGQIKDGIRFGMTANQDSMISSMCEHSITIPCGEENVGPKTKGYTATILTLYFMALLGAKKAGLLTQEAYDRYVLDLETTQNHYQENIERSKRWLNENEESLKELKEIYLVGKGQSFFTASEGALKMMETFLIPGQPFDFEEFLHGPSCSLRESLGGMYFLPTKEDEDYGRIQKLVEYHRSISRFVYTVGLSDSGDFRDCLLLSSGKWYTKPFEEMIPIQLICAMIPGKLGIDGDGMKRFAAIDQFMNIKCKEV